MTALGVNDGDISSFGNQQHDHGHNTKAMGSVLETCVANL
jgi:hypothetical protein